MSTHALPPEERPPFPPARPDPETLSESEETPAHHLPRGVRIVLFIVGGGLVLIGLIGLALPIVPQAIPLALGAAVLSVASDRVYRHLQTVLRRWPRAWRLIQAIRRRLHHWLARKR